MRQCEAFQNDLRQRLIQWDRRIAVLKRQARQAGEVTWTRFGPQVRALERRRQAAAQYLERLQEAEPDKWLEMKPGLDQIWDQLGTAVLDLSKRLSR